MYLANVTLNPLIKFLNKEGRELLSLDRDWTPTEYNSTVSKHYIVKKS